MNNDILLLKESKLRYYILMEYMFVRFCGDLFHVRRSGMNGLKKTFTITHQPKWYNFLELIF